MRDLRASRRGFLQAAAIGGSYACWAAADAWTQPAADDQVLSLQASVRALPPGMQWVQSARTFLVDAYAYPFTPELEFDSQALAEAMHDVHANVVRMATSGLYSLIQGTRFSQHPKLGGRDLLAEVIAACKPRGIRVVPYISTGNTVAWSTVTRSYPQYAQVVRPGAGPVRVPYGTGEDHGTVCWNTPYRQAYLDLVEHVVRDYDIDGIYFDSWLACYGWPRPATCYCEGCRKGFARSTGLSIPYHEKLGDYAPAEQESVRRYHAWYQDQLIDVLTQARRIVKAHKDIPLIYNINRAQRLVGEDPRVLSSIDAFLYERGPSLLHRAEGVSLARALGLAVWPYCSAGASGRVLTGGLDVQQEILVTAMFGGGPIVYNAYEFVRKANDRGILRRPFGIMARHERCFQGAENYPYVAVVWSEADSGRAAEAAVTDARSASLGAFAACLHRHVQASAALPDLLDDPARLNRYKVVYLADLPHLSRQRIDHLQSFVASGGGLIASRGTSLYRCVGRALDRPVHVFSNGFPRPAPKLVRQDRFDLEELLRVRPESPSGALAAVIDAHTSSHRHGYYQDLYLRAGANSGLPEAAAWIDRLIPTWQYQAVAPLGEAVVAGHIVAGEDQVVLPGIVLSRYGKGRVVYLAPALEGLYLQTHLPEISALIASLVQWAAADPAPYTIEAPDCLMTNLTTTADGHVLHLANWTGNKFEQAGLNESYLAPIENVLVRLRKPAGGRIEHLELLVDAPFEQKDLGKTVDVRLPRVEAYQALHFR